MKSCSAFFARRRPWNQSIVTSGVTTTATEHKDRPGEQDPHGDQVTEPPLQSAPPLQPELPLPLPLPVSLSTLVRPPKSVVSAKARAAEPYKSGAKIDIAPVADATDEEIMLILLETV